MTRTLLAIALVALLPSSIQTQSLAGAARKADEERTKAKQEQPTDDKKKADKPSTKVYTNKDLADVPPSTATVASSSSETVTASGSSKTTSDGDGKDESYWRSRAVALRRTLADDQTKLAAAKAHFEALPDQAKGPLGAPIVEAWMKAREEITRLTAIVTNDQRALTELEDEARRVGALPGWLRER